MFLALENIGPGILGIFFFKLKAKCSVFADESSCLNDTAPFYLIYLFIYLGGVEVLAWRVGNITHKCVLHGPEFYILWLKTRS